MTTPTTLRRPALRRFVGHYLEIVVAAAAGMVVLGPVESILVITLAVEVPIDNQIEAWTAATLPGDWRSIQSRWELWHTVRTFASIAAVIAVTVGAVVTRPDDRVQSVQASVATAS
jgi:uncharacterized membrane protein